MKKLLLAFFCLVLLTGCTSADKSIQEETEDIMESRTSVGGMMPEPMVYLDNIVIYCSKGEYDQIWKYDYNWPFTIYCFEGCPRGENDEPILHLDMPDCLDYDRNFDVPFIRNEIDLTCDMVDIWPTVQWSKPWAASKWGKPILFIKDPDTDIALWSMKLNSTSHNALLRANELYISEDAPRDFKLVYGQTCKVVEQEDS